MFRAMCGNLRATWKSLAIADVLFKLTVFILLAPTISLLFRGFLSLSGQAVLADVDIARYFLHPLGWLAGVILGGAIIGVLAIEQSVLMTLSLTALHDKSSTAFQSLKYALARGLGIFQITARMVLKLLVLAAPFLAVAGGIFFLLLTDHDINYYLSQKPPKFWIAVILMGAIFVAFAMGLIRFLVNWSIAIQLHLFENIPPAACLSLSQERVLGHRKDIGLWIILWLVSNVLLSSLASGLVALLAKQIVPEMTGSLWRLVLALGGVLTLWGFVNLVIGMLAVMTSAILFAQVYDRFGRGAGFQLPEKNEALPGWSLRWTRGRLAALLSVLGLGAALVGVLALNTVRLEDHVQITAHRGGAIKAPENTLAAIRQAIQDQTDWVEIDAQESKDGVVIVAHDSDLKKVSGADLKIWDGTAEELRAIDIGSSFGPEFHAERVPTLDEVLKACRGKTRVNIELKYYGHNKNLEEKVVDLVEANGMESDVVIMSLNSEGIDKVKSLRPHWRVGLLTAVAVGNLTRADADFLAVSTKLANRRFIHEAHQNGKDVHVWTVNNRRTMSTMICRGADNLITDDPGLARQVLNEWAELPFPERVLIDFALRFGLVPEMSSEAVEP